MKRNRVKDLARIIMDADLSKRLQSENEFLQRARLHEVSPRWICDEQTNELFERQPDNSYKAAYRLVPVG